MTNSMEQWKYEYRVVCHWEDDLGLLDCPGAQSEDKGASVRDKMSCACGDALRQKQQKNKKTVSNKIKQALERVQIHRKK